MFDNVIVTGRTGVGVVSTANPNRDGSGATELVFTAEPNGAFVNRITVKAVGSTANGMVRIFLDNADVKYLLMEFPVPSTSPTGETATFAAMALVAFNLGPGDKIFASTQSGNTFNVIIDGFTWS